VEYLLKNTIAIVRWIDWRPLLRRPEMQLLKGSFTILAHSPPRSCHRLESAMPRRIPTPHHFQLLKALAGIAIVTGGILLAREAAFAGDPISVMIDRAKVMRISRPADTVIIGNPAIADASIQDNKTLIITGRSFGTTNLIVLDAQGQPIADELLTVAAPDDSLVTVYKRADRQTLSCNPECGPTLAIGDTPGAFGTVKSQIIDHQSLSDSATK
jgi:hypothetical protein